MGRDVAADGNLSLQLVADSSRAANARPPVTHACTHRLHQRRYIRKVISHGLEIHAAAASTSKVGAISIGPSAKIDLVDNDLVVGSGTTKAQVQAYIVSARN